MMKHIGQKYGYMERTLNLLDPHITGMLLCYQHINDNITMPFPIGYSQLCKVLMLIFVLGCPYVIDTSLGVFANVFFPGVIAVALFGMRTWPLT